MTTTEKQDIDFEEVKTWIMSYQKAKHKRKKKYLLNFIVLACTPLVNNIAYGLARRSSDPIEDIIQVGNLGLVKGIIKCDVSLGNIQMFLKYSIINEIKHYLRDRVSTLKAPREILELAFRINQLSLDNIENAGEEYSNNQLAQKLNVSTEKIQEALDIERRRIISLDQLKFNDNNSESIIDAIPDETELENDIEIDKIALYNAINKLPDKLKKVIQDIYFNGIYQKELAKKMKTSQSHISRMQKKALKMLFDSITENKEE